MGQIMENVEKSDVAGKSRERFLNIVKAKLDLFIIVRGDFRSVTNLSCVDIEAEHRLPAGAFPKIKRQETDAATDIQDRIL